MFLYSRDLHNKYHNQIQDNYKKATMVRKSHQCGIGTVGSAFAKFFHPNKYICNKFPNDYKTQHLNNVTIIRDGTGVVRHIQQRCYFCNVPGIDHVLHIVTSNFKVEQPPAIIFEAKRQATDLPGAITPSNAEDENCCSLNNMEQNVSSRRTASKDIADLRRRGITVDDDNEPGPGNIPDFNQIPITTNHCLGQTW